MQLFLFIYNPLTLLKVQQLLPSAFSFESVVVSDIKILQEAYSPQNSAICLLDEESFFNNRASLKTFLHNFKSIVITPETCSAENHVLMMSDGVIGIIHNHFTKEILEDALNEISSEMAYICPQAAKSLMDYFHSSTSKNFDLSEKELEIVKLLVKGEQYASIATMLDISINTVRYHVKSIYRKHNIHNKTVLSRYFHDLVEIDLNNTQHINKEL